MNIGMLDWQIWLIIVVLVIATIHRILRKNAYARYQERLSMLRWSPTSVELRQETLVLGRRYSALTRNKFGVAFFDEFALMNDINAACAGATTPPPNNYVPLATSLNDPQLMASQMASTQTQSRSIEDRLINLTKLRDQGHVSEEEYQANRKRLLDEI
jgi:hypothetical protein